MPKSYADKIYGTSEPFFRSFLAGNDPVPDSQKSKIVLPVAEIQS
jgi:hypothetical protein